MNPEELLKLFSTVAMTKTINEIKPAPSFIKNSFFNETKASLSDQVRVPIKKGAGVVLASIAPNAEHLLSQSNEAYYLDLSIPRFALKDVISASDLNKLKMLGGKEDQTKSLAVSIAEILATQKNSLESTFEFMCAGALFGKVTDGAGQTLFEFKNQKEAISFSDDISAAISSIKKALVDEFGFYPSFSVLCGYGFLSKLEAKAREAGMFNQSSEAKWVQKDGVESLVVRGISFTPYSVSRKSSNGKVINYLEDDKALAIPANHSDIFKVYYTRANHVEALDKAPSMFFSASPEKLNDGKGYSIISESRFIPVCVRPSAILSLKF